MVPVEKLVNDFYRKHNSTNSSKGKFISVVDVVSYLNESYQIWFENKVFMADTNQRIRNDLRTFEVKHKLLEVDDSDCDIVIATYPEDFYQRINQIARVCNKECCPGIEKEIIIRMVQGDDLHEARKNPYRQSDFKWENLIADEAGEGLYIYPDKGTEVKEVYIDYYRKPVMIDAGELVKCKDGYKKYDGKYINFNSDFEVDDTFADRQVSDLAVLIASRDNKDMVGFQSQAQKILQVDKLHKV